MHLFDRDISLTERERTRFTGNITDNWSINGIPNGGYILAILANAMLQHSDKRSTPIVTTNYFSRCTPGAADLSVEEFSRSTQFNRFQAKLNQEGKERVRSLGTFADEKIDCFIERYESSIPPISPLEECVAAPEFPALTILNQVDIRLDPACAGWMLGKLTDRSEMKGWITFRDERPFDLLSVLMFMDAFPPPVFTSQGMMGWVPTIELTVNVRKIPQTRWLKGQFRTRFITCGLLESDGEMWDEAGNLIAISRQIAQFRKNN